MTHLKMSYSQSFVDFGYEPGTLVQGGIRFHSANFRLVCTPVLYKGESLRWAALPTPSVAG
ncbi:hypothetical protein [Nostoc sp. FACHB-190]|uniref:hypothetical protein n=1 Tax=Nostoc sp. FACHB-190 TaxID=2692838 RepID=UPI0016857139|nr:hypothetical protein [Nostoc sp. FACHB-190]